MASRDAGHAYGLAFTVNQQGITLAQASDEIARLQARVAELEAEASTKA